MSDYLEHIKQVIINRRKFIVGATAVVAAGSVAFLRQGGPFLTPEVFPDKWWHIPNYQPAQSPVAILKAANYDENLAERLITVDKAIGDGYSVGIDLAHAETQSQVQARQQEQEISM